MIKNYLTAGKSAVTMAILSAVVLTGCEKESILEDKEFATSSEMQAQAGKGQNMVPNEVLVKFKAGVSADARTAALARIGGNVKERILTKAMERFGEREGLTLVHTPMAALEALSKLKGAAEIEYAEPNYIYTHSATSSDPYYTNGSL